MLFSGTIADNIGYAKHGKASFQEIQAASEAANAHEFIKVSPRGPFVRVLAGLRACLVLCHGSQAKRSPTGAAIAQGCSSRWAGAGRAPRVGQGLRYWPCCSHATIH